MKKENLEIYTDYLICNSGFATATGLSSMLDGDISHDQMTRFLSAKEYTSKDLWMEVKKPLLTHFLAYPATLRSAVLALQHPTANELEETALISNAQPNCTRWPFKNY